MNPTVQKGLETFGMGLGVVVVSYFIQYLTNYHPTGVIGACWGVSGVAIIGGLRALLSWFIIKQQTPVNPAPPATPVVPAPATPVAPTKGGTT